MLLRHIALYTILSINVVFGQSWVGNGPYSKNIRAIEQSPSNPSILYAGAFGWGVFKSIDAGTSWVNQKTGMTNTYVRSLLALSDLVVFAGTNDGVFKTTNGGTSWSLSLTTANSVRSLAYDAANNTLYAATYGSGLYKSIDQGSSWTFVPVTDPVTGQTLSRQRSLAIFAGNSLYVGGSIADIDSGGALFKSVNGGSSWVQVQQGIGIRSSVLSIAVSPVSPATGLIIGTAAKGVYKSANAGQNWSNISSSGTGTALPDLQVNAVGFGLTAYYAGTDSTGKVYSRGINDSTVGWTAGVGLPGAGISIDFVRIHNGANDTMYVGTEGKGVFKSLNAGSTWQALNVGMLGTAARTLKVNGNGTVLVGTEFGDGIWFSTNQAASWTKSETLSTSNSITSLTTTNNSLILYAGAYGTGVYKSVNGGNWWTLTDSTVINHNVRTLVAHPTDPNTVYAGTGNGVYKTANGGASWSPQNSGIPAGTSVRSMALDVSNPSVVYIGSDSSYMYKTTNGGGSWTNITSANGFLPQDMFVRCITIDNIVPANVYAGADSGRIYKSINAGVSWTLLSKISTNYSVRSIDLSPNDRNVVFAATFGSGVFVSIDTAKHWASLNTGLADLEAYSLETDHLNPLNLYVGTGENGVFRKSYSYVNHSPALAPIGNKTSFINQPFSIAVSGTDPDGTIPTLSAQNLPSGSSFVDSGNGKGQFLWTPGTIQIGSFFVTFATSDGVNSDNAIVRIDVLDPNQTVNILENGGWNLISVPLLVPDFQKNTLYPTSVSSAFGYTGSYVVFDTLQNGMGFWLKFPSTQNVSMTGTYLIRDTLDVQAGWNLVGSVTSPLPASAVLPVPPVVLNSSFYGFSNTSGYVAADTLLPGRAYWVKVSEAGQLALGGGEPSMNHPANGTVQKVRPSPVRHSLGAVKQ